MNAPAPEPAEVAAVEDDVEASAEVHPAIRVLGMVVAAVVATILCYAVVASIGEVYLVPDDALDLGSRPTEAALAAAGVAQRAADTGNAMTWLGVSGVLLGGVLALTSGLLQRAGTKAAIGAVAGSLAGGCLGLLAGKLAVSYHASVMATLIGANSNAEQQSMMMHGMTWGLIGIGVGLGCGLSRRTIDVKQVILMIVVAGTMGCVAGGVYPIVVGVAAPLASSSIPIAPAGAARVVWMGLASLLIAAGVGRAS